ncbi:MAG TPA: ATP-binding protein [Stellaceae bacterium]|nr:ATP-binding protein [Stellaceae bacterium]
MLRRVISMLAAGGARRIIVAGALLIAATIAGTFLALWDLHGNAIGAARENTANLGIVLAEEMSRSMQSVDLVLGEAMQRIAHAGAATPEDFRREMASETTHDFLVNRLQALPQLSALFFTDAAGVQVNSSNFWPVPAVSLAASASFLEAQRADSDALVITAPAKSWTTGRWTLFISRRVQSRAGAFLGTVQAMIELGYFENFYKTISLPEGGSISVFRRDGLVLFRHPAIDDMLGTVLSHNSSFYPTLAHGGGTYEAVGSLDGVRREIAVSPVKDYPLAISVTVPEHTALAAWRRQAAFIGLGAGLAVIIFAILFGSLAVQFRRIERSQRALSMALTTTERANRAKSDFLGRMSHELRTPLNAIIGFSETIVSQLFGPVGSPKYKEYAEDILRSGRFLHDLISDMLDMVKIEAGHRDLQLERFAFAGDIDEALRMLRPRAETGEVTLHLEVLDAPDSIDADRRAFKQIVLNLIGNAVKFTPAGGSVIVRLSSSGDDALMRVIDTGVGISAANLEKLGTPFFRVQNNPHQASTEGTGLGVALTKSLIELHDWDIAFTSEFGHGTTVTVTMPGAGRSIEADEAVEAELAA